MRLACEGCDWVTEAGTADELYNAMMEHGDTAHANHFDGKSAEEVQAMKRMMGAHVRQMIVDQN